MTIKMTEKELINVLNKGKISIAGTTPTNKHNIKLSSKKKINKISLSDTESTTAKKTSASVNIHKVIQNIKSSIIKYSISNTHITLIFEDAILLSINQIFAFLQREKQQQFFFIYKKTWHNKIHEALTLIKSENKDLPYFEKDVEITLLRQAPREIDKDALPTMFKFIIDGLKNTKENPLGVLADDNPKVVHTIKFHNEKGEHLVGIKLKLVPNEIKPITSEQLLHS